MEDHPFSVIHVARTGPTLYSCSMRDPIAPPVFLGLPLAGTDRRIRQRQSSTAASCRICRTVDTRNPIVSTAATMPTIRS